MMQSNVFIDELGLDIFIGLHEWELTDRQTVVADIVITIDISQAAKEDDVSFSLNYEELAAHLRSWAHDNHCKTVENFAYDIIAIIKDRHPNAKKIKLCLTKVGVVPHTKGCGVSVEVDLSK